MWFGYCNVGISKTFVIAQGDSRIEYLKSILSWKSQHGRWRYSFLCPLSPLKNRQYEIQSLHTEPSLNVSDWQTTRWDRTLRTSPPLPSPPLRSHPLGSQGPLWAPLLAHLSFQEFLVLHCSSLLKFQSKLLFLMVSKWFSSPWKQTNPR